MAGRPLARARRDAGVRMVYQTEIEQARQRIVSNLPGLIDSLLIAAQGVWVEEKIKGKKGEPDTRMVFQSPPDVRACFYLVDRIMGIPRTEDDDTMERLNLAKAVFIEKQVLADLPAGQKRELEARAERAEMEARMWPQQFVTEEEEQSNIQAMARAANRPLIEMTPEEFAEIIKGKDPSAALEELKGRLGVSQATIIAEVMQYKSEGEEVDEEDD